MSRPHCWLCGNRLMYVSGRPVFTLIVDPIGAEHKVHKECAKNDKRETDEQRRKDFNQFAGVSP